MNDMTWHDYELTRANTNGQLFETKHNFCWKEKKRKEDKFAFLKYNSDPSNAINRNAMNLISDEGSLSWGKCPF